MPSDHQSYEIKHLTQFEDNWDLIHNRITASAPKPALAPLRQNNTEVVRPANIQMEPTRPMVVRNKSVWRAAHLKR